MMQNILMVVSGLIVVGGLSAAAIIVYKLARHAIIWRVILPIKRALKYKPQRPPKMYKVVE